MIRYKFDSRNKLNKFVKEIKQEIDLAKLKLVSESKNLAKMSGQWMARRVTLKTKRRGATGELAAALKANATFHMTGRGGFIIGVGKKSELPVYWAMINYGGHVSPKFVYGFWDDSTNGKSNYLKRGGQGKGTFEASKNGWLMTPRSPIKGFHYIAYAYVRMRQYMKTSLYITKKGKI